MATKLKDEFQFYLDHQDEIVAQHEGKFVVIKDDQVLGAYGSELEALSEARKHHELGTFLIQRVSRGTEAYSQTFHSRAVSPS